MRAYRESGEETVRARDLLKDWFREGFLTEAQYRRMEGETDCEFRRTNIFLRLVLFLFTLMIAGAAVALFFEMFHPRPATQTVGVFLLIFAAVFYWAAELAISQARLYRHGIEEALAVCSVGLLCAGIEAVRPGGAEFLVPAAGAIASLWIWHRFGLSYAFLAAVIFVVWLSDCWSLSHSAQHVLVATFYIAGLIAIAVIRQRHVLSYLNDGYSMVEAFLWLGIYLAINLQLSSVDLLRQRWDGLSGTADFPRMFYWATWVLIWCLPPTILARGVRRKDQFVTAVGTIAAILTLVTNKPYLGWQRHTWDPMLLGLLLIGVALFLRRWLANGPGAVRGGVTSRRLSAKDKDWLNAGATVFGLVSPMPVSPQTDSPDVHFGGGDSGGGGASSDF